MNRERKAGIKWTVLPENSYGSGGEAVWLASASIGTQVRRGSGDLPACGTKGPVALSAPPLNVEKFASVMLELDIRGFLRSVSRNEVETLIESSLDDAKSGQFSKGSAAFLKTVGVTCTPRSDSFSESMLYYQLGLLAAYMRKASLADEMIRKSQTLPGHGGEPPYEDHTRESLVLAERQERAIELGMPSVVLASMPRAASASLTQTLGEYFGIPIMRVSAGAFPHYLIMSSWLGRFLRGGAILHDHFSAEEHNIDILKKSAVRDVFVLIRDPRAAANSLANMGGVTDEQYADVQWQLFTSYVEWTRTWLDFEKQPSTININWISSQTAMRDPQSVAKRIAGVCGLSMRAKGVSIVPANFVTGSDDAWRKRCSDDLRQRMWAEIPSELSEKLNLVE